MARARTNETKGKGKGDDEDDRPAIETAIDSARRHRRKAKKQGDHEVAAFMLRQEAGLLEILAKREDQATLFTDGPADAAGEDGPA